MSSFIQQPLSSSSEFQPGFLRNQFRDKSPNTYYPRKENQKGKKMKSEIEYETLIMKKKSQIDNQKPKPHTSSQNSKIFVCVRKRPITDKEIQNGEIDCVSALNPKLCVYDCKVKIDGYTKYIDTNDFFFDNVFSEKENTHSLYECSIKPTLPMLLQGGVVTCFAYGQTGSGKTFTMKGIQDEAIDSLFETFSKEPGRFNFYVSFYEIYSGRLYDLLNNRNKVQALEDKNQKVQIYGLEEKKVTSPSEMRDVVEYANAMRTTHNTVTNETSSRSHAICNFVIKDIAHEDDEFAKLTLVDLAGSERATETQSNNKSRLAEGAEINKSLLALKECIRALDARKTSGNNDQHVPFRASKLTLVLRDSFISKSNISKIIMISCVSPGYSSANHTINTLRYADRLKEKTSKMNKTSYNNNNNDSSRIGLNTSSNNVSTNRYKYQTKGQNPNGNAFKPKSVNVFNTVKTGTNNSQGKSNIRAKLANQIKKTATTTTNTTSNDFSELVEDNIENLNMNPIPIGYQPKQVQNKKKPYAQSNNNNNISTKNLPTESPCYDKYEKFSKRIVTKKEKGKEKEKEKEAETVEESEEQLIISHMELIKEEAKTLTEEGTMISNIKGLTNENYTMEEYTYKLNEVIDKKLEEYLRLKKRIEEYRKKIK